MDTNLKKSKLLTRILCGWLAVLCLLASLACFAAAYPFAIKDNSANGVADLLHGRVTGLPEYQKRMGRLFYHALLASSGATGLSAEQNLIVAEDALRKVKNDLRQTKILYILWPRYASSHSTNSSYPLFSNGILSPPLGYSVALASKGEEIWGSYALIDAYYDYCNEQGLNPGVGSNLNQPVAFIVPTDQANMPFWGNTATYYAQQATLGQKLLTTAIVCLSAAFLLSLLCLFWRKRTAPSREWAAGLLARVPFEIKLLPLLFLSRPFWSRQFLRELAYSFIAVSQADSVSHTLQNLSVWGLCVALAALLWVLLWLIVVDFSHNRTAVFKNSLCGWLVRTLGTAYNAGMAAMPWQRRSCLQLFVGVAVCAAALVPTALCSILFGWQRMGNLSGPFLAIVGLLLFCAEIALLAYCLGRLVVLIQGMGRISRQIQTLRSGQQITPLSFKKSNPLAATAEDLAALQEGISQMVDDRTRAERMKVELITNVSHDLKTPLTSIISYTQLLQGEPLDDVAKDYAHVIARKADQLKTMVQDVFELSKASSGELVLKPEPLDLAKLVRQTMADMDEAIEASPLSFKMDMPGEAWIYADGDHLYRVFQNLLTNALQYSLAGSRVYVQLECLNSTATARIKNVSSSEIDFNPQSLLERFVRADAARGSEGHGLGLSIAKSFTEACGGEFSISTDADLFCASVSFAQILKPSEPTEDAIPQPLPEQADCSQEAATV